MLAGRWFRFFKYLTVRAVSGVAQLPPAADSYIIFGYPTLFMAGFVFVGFALIILWFMLGNQAAGPWVREILRPSPGLSLRRGFARLLHELIERVHRRQPKHDFRQPSAAVAPASEPCCRCGVSKALKSLEAPREIMNGAEDTVGGEGPMEKWQDTANQTAHEVLNSLTTMMTRLRRMQQRAVAVKDKDVAFVRELLRTWRHDYERAGLPAMIHEWQRPSKVLLGLTIWEEDLHNFAQGIEGWSVEQTQFGEDTTFLLGEIERVSRIVRGLQSFSPEKTVRTGYHAHQLVQQTCEIMADQIAEKQILLQLDLRAAEDFVYIDRDTFVQSLSNLLRNSLHAITAQWGEAGRGRLILRSQVEDDNWCLDVVDNGVGIRSEDQVRLFENYFSTKAPDQGTGLGLSLSRRFMQAQAGNVIFVSSVPREATTFRLIIPIARNFREEVAV